MHVVLGHPFVKYDLLCHKKYIIGFLSGCSFETYTVHHIYSQLNSQPRTTCMPCSKPIRRKYSKNEVILPSDGRGSMACHAVPHVMMYQGDARPSWGRTMAEAIRGFLEGDDGEPKCEIMVASSIWEGAALWFDVSLLITTTGLVRVGCAPPAVLHYYLVLDTSTRLLYLPHVGDRKYIIYERERRRRSILQNSWKGAT